MLNPNPANTLPPDIRKNITERHVAESGASLPSSKEGISYQYLDELFKRGQIALEAKDYSAAVRFLSQCIDLATGEGKKIKEIPYLKENFIIYCQRAEAHFYLLNYEAAIEDARAAYGLNPKCTQAYYLQGQAQYFMGAHAGCFTVLSFGLSQNPSNEHLFDALVDAALNSDQFKDFKPKYEELKKLNQHTEPFVVVLVLGQELLSKGYVEHSAVMLESAYKMNKKETHDEVPSVSGQSELLGISSSQVLPPTPIQAGSSSQSYPNVEEQKKTEYPDKKLTGSVLSSLSCAFYLMGHYEKAISYMKEELQLEKKLDNVVNQCRVLSNMGHTYYKMRNYEESIEAHREHNNLAMKNSLYLQLSAGLNAIGHIHVARNDFTCALTSHSNCLEILKQLGDNEFAQFKELLSIGHIHTMLGDYNSAEERYNEAIQLLNSSKKISQETQHEGSVMVHFNLAYLALKKQSFSEAKNYYKHVIKCAELIPGPKRYLFEMRAANALGQAHRLFKNFGEAKLCFENLLELAEKLNDIRGQSQALCNLGMIAQHSKDYNIAWKLFHKNLCLVDYKDCKDPLLAAYAHSYMGSIYFLTNRYTKAQEHFETSLNIFKDLNYYSNATKTIDLNMAVIQERLTLGRK